MVSWTSRSNSCGRDQLTQGRAIHRRRDSGISGFIAPLMRRLSHVVVVCFLDSLSASLASGVDILGSCSTCTLQPRYVDIRCRALTNTEAVGSLTTPRFSQPKTPAILSTCRHSSLPCSRCGTVRMGSKRPIISNVVDLQP
jgi:hypothetical protein